MDLQTTPLSVRTSYEGMSIKLLLEYPRRVTHIVDLAGRSATDCVSNTDTVDTNLVDSAVQGEEVDEIGSEGVLRGDYMITQSAIDRPQSL